MNLGFHILLIDLGGSAITTLAFQKFIESGTRELAKNLVVMTRFYTTMGRVLTKHTIRGAGKW